MVSGDQLHFHQIQKVFSDKVQGIELYFKLDKERTLDICYCFTHLKLLKVLMSPARCL